MARDEQHPNNLGHFLIAGRVFEVIAANCSSMSHLAFDADRNFVEWRDESALTSYKGL